MEVEETEEVEKNTQPESEHEENQENSESVKEEQPEAPIGTNVNKKKLENLEIEREELEQRVTKLEQSNQDLAGQLQEAKMEVVKFQAMLQKSPEEQLKMITAENEQLKEELQRKRGENKQEKAENKGFYEEKIESLESKLEELEATLAEKQKSEFDACQKEIKATGKLRQIEDQLEEAEKRAMGKYRHFDELNRYIKDLLVEKNKMNELITDNARETANLEYKLEEAGKQRITEKEIQKLELESQFKSEMEIEKMKSNEKIKRLEKDGRELTLVYKEAQEQIDTFEKAQPILERNLAKKSLEVIQDSEDLCERLKMKVESFDMQTIRDSLMKKDRESLLILVDQNFGEIQRNIARVIENS